MWMKPQTGTQNWLKLPDYNRPSQRIRVDSSVPSKKMTDHNPDQPKETHKKWSLDNDSACFTKLDGKILPMFPQPIKLHYLTWALHALIHWLKNENIHYKLKYRTISYN